MTSSRERTLSDAPGLLAKQRSKLETGEYRAGTHPGRFTRTPELEPVTFQVKLGPFEIDRLPYPNDPAQRPLVGVSRKKASSLCAAAGGRLCTELEWERACRGTTGKAFVSGEEWRDECLQVTACASDALVFGMGALAEWTSSDFGAVSPKSGTAVIRGGHEGAEPFARRCAHRQAAPANGIDAVAFRCCYGAPNAAKVIEPTKEGRTFERIEVPLDQLAKMLAGHPKTTHLAQNLSYFERDAIHTVLDRGPGDKKGFLFTTSALLWQPVAGARFVSIIAKSGKDTVFVVTYHNAAPNIYELASSFVMLGDPGPVVFAYSPSIVPRFHFSSCWGCLGETGKIIFRRPDQAVIVQP